jgi:type I site-specific restriction endonuclease
MNPELDTVRPHVRQLLERAGWKKREIHEEENVTTGRIDIRLVRLAIVETKAPVAADHEHYLRLHLQQARRYHAAAQDIPFLIVTDGTNHYIEDMRKWRIERLWSLPSRAHLEILLEDPNTLQDGYILIHKNLYECQFEAIPTAVRHLFDGRPRLLLQMATGTGKGRVAAEVLKEMNCIVWEREDRRLSVLFLVDRDNLETQAVDELSRWLQGVDLKVKDINQRGRREVLVATIQTMYNRYHSAPFHSHYFDLIIVDEAHRSIHGALWREVVEFFDCPQVGMTATPPRFADDATIEYFGDPIYVYDYEDGVHDDLLAPAIIHRVKTNVDKDGLVWNDTLYKSEDFEVSIHVDNRDKVIVDYYEEHFYGRKALVYAASSRHVESLFDKFNEMFARHGQEYRVEFVLSAIESPKARQALIDEFRAPNSNLAVLVNLNILTAGFNFPELDLLLMARYTRHKSLYIQMKGRGTRKAYDDEGKLIKDRFTMVDFVNVTEWEEKEFQPHYPNGAEHNPADDDPMTDPPAPGPMPEADVPVGIAELEIYDPFAVLETAEEDELTRLQQEIEETQKALAEARQQYLDTTAHVQELKGLLAAEQEAHRVTTRQGFAGLVRALQAVAPLMPITEDLLLRANPALDPLETLNNAFGVTYDSIQAHID